MKTSPHIGSLTALTVAASCLFLAWSTMACAQGGGTVNSSAATAAPQVKPATPAANDAEIIAQQKPSYPLDVCPVTGQKLGQHGDPVDYVYKGRLVRFCCSGCIGAFEKEPAKYLAKIDEAAKKAGAASEKNEQAAQGAKEATQIWTCPMHPEVKEAKPGKCPKCGMNLVQAKPEPKKPESKK